MEQRAAIEACLDSIARDAAIGPVAVVAANAVLASRVGHHDAAEAWFNLAIERVGDLESKAALAYRSSLALLRRGRVECIPRLERFADQGSSLSAALNATLATAYVLADRMPDAYRRAYRARDILAGDAECAQRARTLYQIGYVALRAGELTDAKTFAHEAIESARRCEDDDIAARGYSLLYELAYYIECDPRSALRYVELAESFAAKSGDAHIRTWAIMGALYIEMEAGNLSRARERERALSAIDVVQSAEQTSEALVPAQALRCAWNGDFARAYRIVAESGESQISADRRALRFAEAALYAAAAGLTDAARAAIESADWTLAQSPSKTKEHIVALAYLALAAASATGVDAAARRLQSLSAMRAEVPIAMDALIAAVEAVFGSWTSAENHDELLDAFAALRAQYLGGISMLLEALPALA